MLGGLTFAGIGLLIITAACFAPWLAHYDPIGDADLMNAELPPDAQFWFGTDAQGRDIFSRVVYGTRVTLVIVMLVVITVGPLGLLIGCAAGYFGGWVDTVLMRITDVFLAFPRLVLALAFVAALGPGLENAVIAIAFTAWPPYARVARAETLTIRRNDFIAAIRLQGAGPVRILMGHVVPLCTSSLIVRRSTLPSDCGWMPRSDFWIAFSISLSADMSNGLIMICRGSGIEICAICDSGESVP